MCRILTQVVDHDSGLPEAHMEARKNGSVLFGLAWPVLELPVLSLALVYQAERSHHGPVTSVNLLNTNEWYYSL